VLKFKTSNWISLSYAIYSSDNGNYEHILRLEIKLCALFVSTKKNLTSTTGLRTFLLLPAALRLLLWITAASGSKIFYILHCFCSAFTHWAYPASTRLFGLLSTKYTHTADEEFLIMHGHHNFCILNCIIMCTAASIFIKGHMRPSGRRLCTSELHIFWWYACNSQHCVITA